MRNKTIFYKIIIFVFSFLIIFAATLNSEEKSKPQFEQKSEGLKINNVLINIIDRFTNEVSQHTQRTNVTIQLLSIFVGIFVLFFSIISFLLMFYYERKRSQYEKKYLEFYEEKLNNLSFGLEKDIKEKLIEQIEDNYIDYFNIRLKESISTVEDLNLQVEKNRWKAWGRTYFILKKFLKQNDWTNFLSIWNDYNNFQMALVNLLSHDQNDINSGLGVLVSSISAEIIPKSIWDLILNLMKHKRFRSPNTIHMIELLGSRIGKSL